MPVAAGDQKRILALPGEVAFDLLAGLLINLLLLLLPDAVEGFKLSGAFVGIHNVFGLQQLQSDIGISDPAGGIDPWGQPEGDIRGSQFGAQF